MNPTPWALVGIDAGCDFRLNVDVDLDNGDPYTDLEDVEAVLTVYAGTGEVLATLTATGDDEGRLAFTLPAAEKETWPHGRLPFTVDTVGDDTTTRLFNGTFDHREPYRD